MEADWDVKPLGDLVEDIIDRRGVTPLKLGSDFTATGHRVISAKVIKNRRVDLAADEPRYIDDATFAKWMKSPLRGDDVVLTSEAPLGEPAYLPNDEDWVLGQRLFAIRTDKSQLHGRFLYYALQADPVRSELLSRATGTTVTGVRQSELRKVRIPHPQLDEQRRIAHILGTLDDKIELNRRMNETLEEMARSLFKSWFVDFDPVRAKSEGRDPGLSKHLSDLFPDRLVDSELGPIPDGWRAGTIAQLCTSIFSGGTPSTGKSEFWDGTIPWLSSGETRSKFISATEKAITRAGVENSSTRLAPARATVIASAGQGHTRGQTSLLAIDAYVNQSVVALVADPDTSGPLHLFFDLERRYEQFRQVSDGQSSRGSLTTRLLAGLPAIVPPHQIVPAFESLVEDAVARCFASILESQSLREQRDVLLARLLNRATEPVDFEMEALGA